ncbi:MAG TPA: hypothetical protein VFR47_16980 [Anaerolineales bacterium]|nr:hypothetical protein [Anaerolineales bacterium]
MNFKSNVTKQVSSRPERNRNDHSNRRGWLGKVRFGVLIVAWLLLIPFYGGWAIGIARGFPISSPMPPLLLVALLLFVIYCGNRTAGVLVLTLMIPLGSQWILMDRWDDAREEMARGNSERAIQILETQRLSWWFRFPSSSHVGEYATLSEAYCDSGRYDQCRHVIETVIQQYGPLAGEMSSRVNQIDDLLPQVQSFDESQPVNPSTLNAWLDYARLLEDGLFAPSQAIRIHKQLVESGLSPDLEKEVLTRYIETLERRASRNRE